MGSFYTGCNKSFFPPHFLHLQQLNDILECSFKPGKNSEERRSCRCHCGVSSRSVCAASPEINVRARAGIAERPAGSHSGDMRHAAGSGAADDLDFFSQRDSTHRPGSCPLLITYYRLVGSPLNERESPHRI